jgi:hypothetical protein
MIKQRKSEGQFKDEVKKKTLFSSDIYLLLLLQKTKREREKRTK